MTRMYYFVFAFVLVSLPERALFLSNEIICYVKWFHYIHRCAKYVNTVSLSVQTMRCAHTVFKLNILCVIVNKIGDSLQFVFVFSCICSIKFEFKSPFDSFQLIYYAYFTFESMKAHMFFSLWIESKSASTFSLSICAALVHCYRVSHKVSITRQRSGNWERQWSWRRIRKKNKNKQNGKQTNWSVHKIIFSH